ncbi:hypothetical protein [Acidithiobacillus ferrianus]|uniref:hypothetical protein n=1 Tax=Acidithiobacillus ferrianus TaxID=2678518 RepID=UPI0034E5FA9F
MILITAYDIKGLIFAPVPTAKYPQSALAPYLRSTTRTAILEAIGFIGGRGQNNSSQRRYGVRFGHHHSRRRGYRTGPDELKILIVTTIVDIITLRRKQGITLLLYK